MPYSKIILASTNNGKLTEFNYLLQQAPFQLTNLHDYGIEQTNEPFPTFIENALVKARYASQLSNLPALGDDSGLVVPSLGGAPGIYSARYANSNSKDRNDVANNKKLVEELKKVTDRRAYYYCALVLVASHNDPCPIVAEGLWHGQLLLEPKGENGFAYDPYFYVPRLARTVGELIFEEKNLYSHRSQAVTHLLRQINSRHLSFKTTK